MSIQPASETRPWEGGPSFSFSNRVLRTCWTVIWVLCARWNPPQLAGWRRMLLRLFGAKIAPTAIIRSSAKIWLPSNLEMEDHACLGPHVNCYNMAMVTLRRYAVVSQGANLCTGSHLVDDEHFQLVAKPIEISEYAWVAADAFVGPGVKIGEGAVLAARGVTFLDLSPWTVYLGNPAVAKRPRRMIQRS
jgi:putative colanic acid biosynthesis acetyltransferase WcaF